MSDAPLPLKGRRVVVTGGHGFLGRHVCRLLEEREATVVSLGRSDFDLTEQAQVRRLYQIERPSVVLHLAAACGGIGANVENPGRFLYENSLMGLLLLEEARHAGVDKFVLVSTTCAYPRDAPLPLHEDSLWEGKPVGATGPYGMAKRLLHEACATFERQYGVHAAVVVPANLYGPEDHFDEERSHVIPALIRRFVEAVQKDVDEVVNWGTGKPTREFLYVTDAARGIVLAAEKPIGAEPINLGTGKETSVLELTQIVAEAVGYKGRLGWDTTKPDGQPRRYLDVSRARDRLGFQAKVALKDGIAETVKWYKERAPNG